MKDAEKTLQLIIDYCESRLKERRPMNTWEWLAGYDYVLSRILGIARTGEVYNQISAEEQRKANIKYWRKRLSTQRSALKENDARRKEIEKDIARLEKELADA